MVYHEHIKDRLREFKDQEGLESAFIATRSGNFITGFVPSDQHRDTLVAMAAIVHGGSETISMESKKPLDYVLVKLSDRAMAVHNVGTKALLVVMASELGDGILGKIRDLIEDLDAHIG